MSTWVEMLMVLVNTKIKPKTNNFLNLVYNVIIYDKRTYFIPNSKRKRERSV